MGNQSGFIVGFILAAFFVYITLKGELPVYAGLLLLSPAQSPNPSGPQNLTSSQNNALVTGAATVLGLY